MEEDNIVTDESCPHYRARIVFDGPPTKIDNETGPLVVRLDDQGRTTIVGGWQGNFNPAPIGYAWKEFGKPEQVCKYLLDNYSSRADFVGVPDPRTFAFVVVAHHDYIAEFGGAGEEAPGEQWVSQALAQSVKEVESYAAGQAWSYIVEERLYGLQTRTFQNERRAPETVEFSEWDEALVSDSYLDYDFAVDEAERHLAGEVYDCKKRTSHGA